MHSILSFVAGFMLPSQGHLIGEKYQAYQNAGITENPRLWILITMHNYAYNKTLIKLIIVSNFFFVAKFNFQILL
jgi:hypothetical protein